MSLHLRLMTIYRANGAGGAQFDMQIDHKDTHVPEITNFIEQCHPWESDATWASKEIPRVLWDPKVHCRIHKSPPPLPVLSQRNPVHASPSHFLEIYFNITLPSTPRSPKFSVPFSFPDKNLVCTSYIPLRTTFPAYLILLDMLNRIILGEEYRSLSSSLCNFLHSPVTSSFLGQISSWTPYSRKFSPRPSLNVTDQVSHPYKTTGNIIVLYIVPFIFLDIWP